MNLRSPDDIDNQELCIWKDLYYAHQSNIVNGTTFQGSERWNKDHPLYPCTECLGYNTLCEGYRPLRIIVEHKSSRVRR